MKKTTVETAAWVVVLVLMSVALVEFIAWSSARDIALSRVDDCVRDRLSAQDLDYNQDSWVDQAKFCR